MLDPFFGEFLGLPCGHVGCHCVVKVDGCCYLCCISVAKFCRRESGQCGCWSV